MKTIRRYFIDQVERQAIMVPTGAKILGVECTTEILTVPYIVALVDTQAEERPYFFRTFRMNEPITDEELGRMVYVGNYAYDNKCVFEEV